MIDAARGYQLRKIGFQNRRFREWHWAVKVVRCFSNGRPFQWNPFGKKLLGSIAERKGAIISSPYQVHWDHASGVDRNHREMRQCR